jgi:hypothetical protein
VSALLLRAKLALGATTSARPIRDVAQPAYALAGSDEPGSSAGLVVVDVRAHGECARDVMPKTRPSRPLLDNTGASYQESAELLVGWEPRVFKGLKPGWRVLAQTSYGRARLIPTQLRPFESRIAK